MSLLVIRAHKRFAVCRRVPLRKGRAIAGDGLLIELSLEGCRISQIQQDHFREGEELHFNVEGYGMITGAVRWSQGNCVGLRLSPPLHQAEMANLLDVLREGPEKVAAAGG
ncbi:PilZ domain-containing protein [Novosphingobium sp. ZN18A2]|uniref:PilZ domain-containing protein n=1 Tax=Novosphingobium sp. ZN18A2 TaxID=3079861 RepID=UPI0030D0B385